MSHPIRLPLALAILCTLTWMAGTLAYADDHCTVTLDNRSPWQVALFIDGHYGCTANANMECSSTETQDAHHIEARVNGNTMQSIDSPAGRPAIYFRVWKE